MPSSLPSTSEQCVPEPTSYKLSQSPDLVVSEAGTKPQLAMLQKHFQTAPHKALNPEITALEAAEEPLTFWATSELPARNDTVIPPTEGGRSIDSVPYKWQGKHPPSIGKNHPHPRIQHYEARLPYLTGMVLNIFGKESNGGGGLLLVLEVRSPCGEADSWVEVDRARCSSRYPCSLRLPAGAVRGSVTQPTSFRTRVITEYEDYLTDYLVYDRVTLNREAEVTVAHRTFKDVLAKRTLKFNLSAVLASGALSVTPVLQNAAADTVVSMRIRQPKPREMDDPLWLQEQTMQGRRRRSTGDVQEKTMLPIFNKLGEKSETSSSKAMHTLTKSLQSYRLPWAEKWREASRPIAGCGYGLFEVVADQLYPGEVELEVWTQGGNNTVISDVLVTMRVSWSEAEIALLDAVLKDHFGYFNDPEVIIHGIPIDAYRKDNPARLPDSNPTSWGYAMESWVIMAETGVLQPQDVVAKLNKTFETIDTLQQDPNSFVHGLLYPYFSLRDRENGAQMFPQSIGLKEIPCGDDALLYTSLMMVQGWLTQNKFNVEAKTCAKLIDRMDFSKCLRVTDCNTATNGQLDDDANAKGDKFWSVPLTFNADTLEPNTFNWNVWADEGGVVAMIVALTGAVNDTQYESIVRQQQKYSPCGQWEGVTVGQTAFFNSIFTLPTRSLLGLGTLFASPYYHEFAVRSVLPSFRAHQKLKKKLGIDYMGPSDAMTQTPKLHPERTFGSYAYWPPNNFYDCRKREYIMQNQCTWCKGIQVEGFDDPFDMIVPHGVTTSFLASAMMEKSLFTAWLEDLKLLMTDWSGVYTPGYGLEVVAPSRRTPHMGNFDGAFDGRQVWEALSHGYTILSMYEGLATMRRRFELAKREGLNVPETYEPPKYKPLSDFMDGLPKVRSKINKLLAVASEQVSTERECSPSEYGPEPRGVSG